MCIVKRCNFKFNDFVVDLVAHKRCLCVEHLAAIRHVTEAMQLYNNPLELPFPPPLPVFPVRDRDLPPLPRSSRYPAHHTKTRDRLLSEAQTKLKDGYDKEHFLKKNKHLDSLLCAMYVWFSFWSLARQTHFDSQSRKIKETKNK